MTTLVAAVMRRVLLTVLLLTAAFAASPAFSQTPPPEKVNTLIELLNDPAVKAWLDEQKAKPPASSPPAEAGASPFLSEVLSRVEAHVKNLREAIPRLPGEFTRAWNILQVEFEEQGLFHILLLILGFIAAGMGADRLLRYFTSGYRKWMMQQSHLTPQGRVKALGGRLLYALLTTTAFVIGSAGVFLLFNWPPLLREIVLAYLMVAIIVRAVMMTMRALLLPPHLKAPNASEIRVLPLSDQSAAHWYRWVAINVAWVAFANTTLMLLGTFGFQPSSRMLLGVGVGFVELLLLLATIWLRPAGYAVEDGPAVSNRWTASSWLFTAFLILLLLIRASGDSGAFWFVLAIVALPAAILLARSAVSYTLRPPADPAALPIAPVVQAIIDRAIRLALIVATVVLLTRVWELDVMSMSQREDLPVHFVRGLFHALVIILAADFAWSIIKALILRKLGAPSAHVAAPAANPQQARMRTLLPIFQNILFATIMIMALLMSLSAIGIEIGPLIAGAGVVGVAVGFGAQTLVKDVISGVFYLLDDAFTVGEYIESGSYKGTVEGFSLRSVKLRHSRGYLFTVPFGELGAVQNMSRDWVIDKFSITVGYDTDVDKARKIIKKIGQQLAEDPEFKAIVIEPLKMQGVQNFGNYGIELRIKMKTKPGEQFTMKRRAYVLIKKAFDEAGITLPLPTVQVRDGSDARAAAANLVQELEAEKAVAAAAAT